MPNLAVVNEPVLAVITLQIFSHLFLIKALVYIPVAFVSMFNSHVFFLSITIGSLYHNVSCLMKS